MKTITVRDLRHKWPQAESWLQEEGELLVTRDSKPIAKLVKVAEKKPRKRFSAKEQAKWRRSIFGAGPPQRLVDEMLKTYRKERWEE
jgi:antitoxin (DNA-binding transcriptional repressor) of toxin-antitoxin stability system